MVSMSPLGQAISTKIGFTPGSREVSVGGRLGKGYFGEVRPISLVWLLGLGQGLYAVAQARIAKILGII